MVGLENFELAGIKSYTRFWGLLMFGSYSVINVIVLLNLLIAMMSNSYAMIDEHSDTEWKFARTRLWMSYFEESATLPPPFNILPTPKLLLKMMGIRKKDKMRKIKTKEQKEKEHDVRYTAVMRAVVWRYVSAMHRKMDDEPVTEDDINEMKGDISALRYELLEVFEKNGMDVSFTDRKEKMVLGKRMKVWERRLMKDFHVAPVALEEEEKKDEDGLSRFRRIAKLAVASTTNAKWDQTLQQTGVSSQIGRCRSRESFKNQQNLQRAMAEARKLVLRSPLPGSRGASPIEMPVSPGHTLLELIKDFSTETGDPEPPTPVPKSPWKPPGAGGAEGGAPSGGLLTADARSRPVTPQPRTPSPAPVKMHSRGPASAAGSRSPSPGPKAPSPTESSPSPPEPSPLKAKRVPGESPPKVIKRKPQSPPTQPDDETPKDLMTAEVDPNVPEATPEVPEATPKIPEAEPKAPEDIAVARPVAPDIKPSEGAIPPPPPPVKPKAPPAPSMSVTPSTPTRPSPPSPPSSPSPPQPPSRSASPQPGTSQSRTASPQPSVTVIPADDVTPPSPPKRLASSSSTEQLIPTSPEPLRAGKKIEEVKTIKRQQKTGWL